GTIAIPRFWTIASTPGLSNAFAPAPEVGAQCGSPARWDLSGGRPESVFTTTKGRPHRHCPTASYSLAPASLRHDHDAARFPETRYDPRHERSVQRDGYAALRHERRNRVGREGERHDV